MPRTSISFERGFYPSAGLVGPTRVPNSAIDGQNILFLGPNLMKSAKGIGGGPGIPGGKRLYLVGSKIGVVDGDGSVVAYTRDSYFYVSSGQTTVGNLVLPSSNGALRFYYNGQSYNAGLPAPPVPTLVAGATGTSTGKYAIVITRKRTVSNGESNPSPRSNVLDVKAKKVRINFPPAPALNSPDYHDKWGVYARPVNSPNNGPYLLLKDVDVAITSIELDWDDGDLAALEPPTDHDPPPMGKFVIALGGTLVVLGTFGGAMTDVHAGVSPSLFNQPDAFPPSLTTYLNPQESIIGLAGGAEGEYYIWTKNSLQALLATSSPEAPVQVRTIWSKQGIQSPHGGCFANSEFYAFTGKAGPVRLGAGFEPDTVFALPVREWIRKLGWNAANVVVGYDPVYDAIVYMHGNIALAYMRSLGIWSCPILLNAVGTAKAALTFEGALLIGVGNGIFEWEAGNGLPQDWFITPAWQEAPRSGDRCTITGYRVCGDLAGTQLKSELLIDFSDTPAYTLTDTQPGAHYTDWTHINKRCRAFTIKHSGKGSDHYIYDTEIEMLYPGAIREKK